MSDPRHLNRLKVVQELYSMEFMDQQNLSEKAKLISKEKDEIDVLIEENAPRFPVNKIARTDLAILRLAIYELMIEKKEPAKVIINEAVELAKELGSDKAYAFINAVLGKIYGPKSA